MQFDYAFNQVTPPPPRFRNAQAIPKSGNMASTRDNQSICCQMSRHLKSLLRSLQEQHTDLAECRHSADGDAAGAVPQSWAGLALLMF